MTPQTGTAPTTEERGNSVRSAVLWSYVLTGGRVGATTLVTFLLAKLLGPAEFGLIAMALIVLNLAQMLLQHGLPQAIVQRGELTDRHLEAAFFALLLAGLGLGAVMAALSPLWGLANRDSQLTLVCLALAPLVPVFALMMVPEAILRRQLRFQAIAVRTLIAVTAGGVVGIGMALAGYGVWALVGQQVVTGVLNTLVLWLMCRWRPRQWPRLRALRDLGRFSAHSTNAGVALFVCTRADQLVTGLMFGSVAVGIYRLAIRLPEMLVEVTVRSLQQVALPALSRLQDDRPAFGARLSDLQHLGAVVALPLIGLLAGVAGPLVDFLGPQWAGTELPLRILCLYAAVHVYGVLLGPALQAAGHPGRLAALAWIRGGVAVLSFLVVGWLVTGLSPVHQAAAIAAALVAVEIVITLMAVHWTRRTIGGVRFRLFTPTVPAILAGLAAFGAPVGLATVGVAAGVPLLAVLLGGVVGGLAAAGMLGLTDRRARALVRQRLRRSAPAGA